jgi:hypothetical protein
MGKASCTAYNNSHAQSLFRNLKLYFLQHFEPICCKIACFGPNCCTLCNNKERRVRFRKNCCTFYNIIQPRIWIHSSSNLNPAYMTIDSDLRHLHVEQDWMNESMVCVICAASTLQRLSTKDGVCCLFLFKHIPNEFIDFPIIF